MPSVVPMLPATIVPVTPTMSDTRAPKNSRLSTSRPWKSGPSSAAGLAPAFQKGGARIWARGIGWVGSWGAIRSANPATSRRERRIVSGSSGHCRARASHSRRSATPAGAAARAARNCSVTNAMRHLFGQADTRVDVAVEDVDQQVDDDDHDAGLHHDALHEREVALKNALVQQPADARP